jgi:hypothetical protein
MRFLLLKASSTDCIVIVPTITTKQTVTTNMKGKNNKTSIKQFTITTSRSSQTPYRLPSTLSTSTRRHTIVYSDPS